MFNYTHLIIGNNDSKTVTTFEQRKSNKLNVQNLSFNNYSYFI